MPAGAGGLRYEDPAQPATSDRWKPERLEEIRAEFVASRAEVLVVGDSIAAQWRRSWPGEVETCFFGYPGDQTCHVLWRLVNTPVEAPRFTTVVLIVGTNNTGIHYQAHDIFRGVEAIVTLLHRLFPGAGVIVNSILPRGPDLMARDEKIRQANALMAAAATPSDYIFLNAYEEFRAICGTSNACGLYRPDHGHLTPAGYEVLYRLLRPHLPIG